MRAHALRLRFPAPGAVQVPDGWELRWEGTAVMGVLNVTPDSFSDGGRHADPEVAVEAALAMTSAGALVVDVGGESTRPGAAPVAEREELRRVLPVVEALAGRGVVISVDTMKPGVAREALAAGAHLVNDVSGLRDPTMRRVCAEAGAPAVVTHMLGEPATMQKDPRYDDVSAEVFGSLRDAAALAITEGVPSVMLDPGIGFGKTVSHNLTLLHDLPRLTAEPAPVLVGASRKRFIHLLADAPEAASRDAGSIALHLHAADAGAAMVRVHDVPGHVQALRVWEVLRLGRAYPRIPS